TIPFVGGVVSSALNFGLGIVIDMVNEFLTDQVMALTKDIIDDVVKDVKLATAASKGEAGLVAGAMVGALNNFVLKGISDPDVRAVLSAAVETVADNI